MEPFFNIHPTISVDVTVRHPADIECSVEFSHRNSDSVVRTTPGMWSFSGAMQPSSVIVVDWRRVVRKDDDVAAKEAAGSQGATQEDPALSRSSTPSAKPAAPAVVTSGDTTPGAPANVVSGSEPASPENSAPSIPAVSPEGMVTAIPALDDTAPDGSSRETQARS